jgi:hypothetical protein
MNDSDENIELVKELSKLSEDTLRAKLTLRIMQNPAMNQLVFQGAIKWVCILPKEMLVNTLLCGDHKFVSSFEILMAETQAELAEDANEKEPVVPWNLREIIEQSRNPNPNAIIGVEGNYLARGSASVTTSLTGRGKSVMAIQEGTFFANGAPFAGKVPCGELVTVLFESENDEYDAGEALDGAIAYCARVLNKSVEEVMAKVETNFHIFRVHCTSDELPEKIREAIKVVKVKVNKAVDIVYLDPLLGYFGGLMDPTKTQAWLYTVMTPLMQECQFVLMMTHHAPASMGRDRSTLGGDYTSFGGAVLPGWVRAVSNLLPTDDSEVYLLVHEKRSKRLRNRTVWPMRCGQDGKVFWDIMGDEEAKPFIEAYEKKQGKAKKSLKPLDTFDAKALKVQAAAVKAREDQNLLFGEILSTFEVDALVSPTNLLTAIKKCGGGPSIPKCYVTLRKMKIASWVKKTTEGYKLLKHPDVKEPY